MRKAASCLTFLAVLALLCSFPQGAWAGGGPEDAVNTFFGALKKGDMAAAKKVFSGPALQTPPKEGSPQYESMKLWGEAFQGMEGMKVEGDKATCTAKMDGMKIANMMMAKRRAMLDEIKDPAQRADEVARFDRGLKSFAAKLSALPITLAKINGDWMIQEIK